MSTLGNAQRNTLLTAVKADTGASKAASFRTAGDVPGLMGYLNAAAAGPVLAWRTQVQPQDSDEAATYTTYDTLAAGKRDSWVIFLKFTRNFSRNKVRSWITDVWGGATGGSVAEAILQAGTESATWAQNAIGGTDKGTGTVTAKDRTYTSTIDVEDCTWLINQP